MGTTFVVERLERPGGLEPLEPPERLERLEQLVNREKKASKVPTGFFASVGSVRRGGARSGVRVTDLGREPLGLLRVPTRRSA